MPLFRELGFVKDQWHFDGQWTPPAEYGQPGKRTASEIAKEFKGTPAKSGSGELWEPYFLAIEYARGGVFGRYTDNTPALPSATSDHMRIIAAMALNGCRATGGRVHVPREDYGAMGAITGIEAIFQSGVLDEKEFNEFENFMTLSAVHPDYYWYDNIGANNGFLNEIGDRHGATSLLINVYLLDYVRNHCHMDERTRKEIDRRYEGTLKSTAYYINSYRDNFDTYELGETTMMYFYAMLYEGMPQWIANGNLRHAADLYILTSDNIPDHWGILGCYAGLDSYIGAGPGMPKNSWHGRGIVSAAAFYLDDPQYRWFSVGLTGHSEGIHGSVGTPFLGMHWEVGETTAPTRYTGVRSLPFDKRLFDLATSTDTVTFENTPMVGTIYYGIGRLPTWRIAVGQKARQIKILPRETKDKNSVVHDPGKGGLRLTEIEVYGSHEADDLGIQAFASDVNGDGANELVVGTVVSENSSGQYRLVLDALCITSIMWA